MADELIESAAERLGYVLKEEQRKVVSSFVSGEDVFGILPTGYGKSLCYTCLPEIFDGLRASEDSLLSIVIVVIPLVAIAKDQVSVFIL